MELENNLHEVKVLIFFLIIRQDSLLDIVTSLGADEEKIILAGTAKANRFNLLDVSRNTPGSASVGMASTITYQQVCSLLLLLLCNLKINQNLHVTQKYLEKYLNKYFRYLPNCVYTYV